MSWNNRNGSNNGARSKTFRNESSSSKKKNRNFSESSDDGNWNRPKPPSTYSSSGIWDDVPDNRGSANNAWNENLVSKWSENSRSSTSEPRRQNGGWSNIDTEFPALESIPKPPTVNVWEVRRQKAIQKKALEPSNETEEERMLRQAIELSKIENKRDEVKRRELEEEYLMQKHLLETDPSLYSEFYTDEEIAAILPAREEKNNYEAKYQNSFSEEEYRSQNPLHNGSTLPSKSDQLGNNPSAQLPSGRSGDSKEKISKAVDMFGGWGKTRGNSQNLNKNSNSTCSGKMQPKGNPTKYKNDRVIESKGYEKSQESQSDDSMWNTDDPVPSRNSVTSKTHSSRNRDSNHTNSNTNILNKKEETDEDWAWKTDDNKLTAKSYNSKQHSSSEDEDKAWKTDDPEPYSRSETTCSNNRAEADDSAWETEDPKSSNASVRSKTNSLRKREDDDYAWKTDDPEPYSRSETKCSNNRAGTDDDQAWKTEDPIPSNRRKGVSASSKIYTMKKNEEEDEDYAWKTDDPKPKSKAEASSASRRTEIDQDRAWKTEDSKSKAHCLKKNEDYDEDSAWKANDPKPSKDKMNSFDRKLETDQDRTWQTEDSKPKTSQNNSIKSSLLKTQNSSWGSVGNSSLQGSVVDKMDVPSTRIEKHEQEAWNSSNPTSNGEHEHSLISRESIASEKNHEHTASIRAAGSIADNIVFDYVNLASSQKTDDQNLTFSNASEPSPDKSVFELLKNDYGKHFVTDSNGIKSVKKGDMDSGDSLKNTSSFPGESLSKEGGYNNTLENSNGTSSDIVSANSIQPDDDISLPLFATSFSEADQSNVSKIPVSDEFRQSFGAHFQQFQSISTITPVYMMNPYMMQGMSPMGFNPMMPQMSMNPMIQPMCMNPLMPQMTMNPMMPQMGMNPMMQQRGMVQPNPMMPSMGLNPMMQHMSVYQQMSGNTMLPQSNIPGISSSESSLDLNQYIPPPTDSYGFNQGNDVGNSSQIDPMGASSSPMDNFGKDEWLDQFLTKPVFGDEPISAPTMPQTNTPCLEPNGVNSSAIPPSRGMVEAPFSNTSAEGYEYKPVHNSSGYISERKTEIRQPASMPSWGRGK